MNINPKNILVIKWGALGDMVISTGAIRSVKETFPNACVVLLSNSLMKQIAPAGSIVDKLLVYDEKKYRGVKSITQLFKLILNLRRYKFDLAINLRWHSDRCAIIAYLSGAKERVSSGPQNMMNLYTTKVPFPNGRYHEVHRNLDIVKAVGVKVKDETPYTHISLSDEKFASDFLFQNKLEKENTICIHPGASKPIRAWSPDRFREISKKLVEQYDVTVIVTWSGKEKELAEFVVTENPKKMFLAPQTKTIGELAALIKYSKMCLTNCTGPMNVAVAVQTPTCAILGSSDPTDWAPYGEIHRTIKSPLVLESYTDEQEEQAMQDVSIEQVWSVVSKRWEELT
ncbi:MAG: Three-deoxy-D-manno-octulosonic-acid transferase domain protein [Ignavibacteria bacterium]|nr:MAG: Three-deoxy-D-manno-octulosonic-acid transferase domain protein [Ignavibacteria bacterium]KAF0160485.1 MAG: Three-deoxy-D-manno-octulosonic-acid transferase domain protein [Ignavibacteria bacterium]